MQKCLESRDEKVTFLLSNFRDRETEIVAYKSAACNLLGFDESLEDCIQKIKGLNQGIRKI